MQQRRSVSFPSYIDGVEAAPDAARAWRLARLALGAWAAVVYVIYWLGELGLR
jgi:hypothetical protein